MKELVDDPFFEFAFDMLNDDDKMEFPDVGEEIHRKRVRHRQAHDREQNKRRRMAAPRLPVRLPVTGGAGPPPPAPGPPGPEPAPPPLVPKPASTPSTTPSASSTTSALSTASTTPAPSAPSALRSLARAARAFGPPARPAAHGLPPAPPTRSDRPPALPPAVSRLRREQRARVCVTLCGNKPRFMATRLVGP